MEDDLGEMLEEATIQSDQDPADMEAALIQERTPVLLAQVADTPSDQELAELGRLLVQSLQLRRKHDRSPSLVLVVRPREEASDV